MWVSNHENEKWGIRQGDIYIRDGDQTVRLDDLSKLYEKLDDLIYKYQEAEQFEASTIPSPFEVDTGFYRLLPPEYETFVGRTQLLDKIRNAIEKDPRIWIINLYGPGGVGKSALATRIAYEYYDENRYEAILHLSAKDRELSAEYGIKSLRPSLISIEDFIDRILHLFSHEEYCTSDLATKKAIVNELLCGFSTLFILDNMETVTDGRIMDFIREFPPSSKAKVLLTSRQRTSEWEMPVRVPELSETEVKEFIITRSKDLRISFPYLDEVVIKKITELSGGLPLAIQWILGDFAKTGNLEAILKRVITPDSPLLEFSFRNSWNSLDSDSQQALAILSIFNEAPTFQEWRTALNWPIDRTERAAARLVESTFVSERTDQKTGNKIYIALPITLSFSRNELTKFGDLGMSARSRYEIYRQRITLAEQEADQFEGIFTKFEAKTDNQKKAILLARMAEAQLTSLGYEEAEEYYKQALDVDPISVYVLTSYAKFKADILEYAPALDLAIRAIPRITKKTGFFVYYNIADIYGRNRDWNMKVKYLSDALNYETNRSQRIMAQHSLGVALGQLNRHEEAIRYFDMIIDEEMNRPYGPTQSLIVAARTKNISLQRTNPGYCKVFIDDLIGNCRKLKVSDYMIDQLVHIRDFG